MLIQMKNIGGNLIINNNLKP